MCFSGSQPKELYHFGVSHQKRDRQATRYLARWGMPSKPNRETLPAQACLSKSISLLISTLCFLASSPALVMLRICHCNQGSKPSFASSFPKMWCRVNLSIFLNINFWVVLRRLERYSLLRVLCKPQFNERQTVFNHKIILAWRVPVANKMCCNL